MVTSTEFVPRRHCKSTSSVVAKRVRLKQPFDAKTVVTFSCEGGSPAIAGILQEVEYGGAELDAVWQEQPARPQVP